MIDFIFQRLVVALSGTPDVLDSLTGGVESHSPTWDYRPDPDRFTLREIVAHLTDYESIFLDRYRGTIEDETKVWVRTDPAQLAVDNNYSSSNPLANLSTFRKRRQQTVAFFKSLDATDWNKSTIFVPPFPSLSIDSQAMFLAVHDGYHTGQIAQWLKW